MSKVSVIVEEREQSPGIFDLDFERQDDWPKIRFRATSFSKEQVDALLEQVEVLDEDDKNYSSRIFAIARAKGGEHVVVYSRGSGTIHKPLCGSVLRSANAEYARDRGIYDVDVTDVVARAKSLRTQIPKVCQRCSKDLVLIDNQEGA